MAIKLYKSQLTPTTESSNVMNRNRVSMSEAASIGNAWKGMVRSGELLYAKHQDIKTDNEVLEKIKEVNNGTDNYTGLSETKINASQMSDPDAAGKLYNDEWQNIFDNVNGSLSGKLAQRKFKSFMTKQNLKDVNAIKSASTINMLNKRMENTLDQIESLKKSSIHGTPLESQASYIELTDFFESKKAAEIFGNKLDEVKKSTETEITWFKYKNVPIDQQEAALAAAKKDKRISNDVGKYTVTALEKEFRSSSLKLMNSMTNDLTAMEAMVPDNIVPNIERLQSIKQMANSLGKVNVVKRVDQIIKNTVFAAQLNNMTEEGVREEILKLRAEIQAGQTGTGRGTNNDTFNKYQFAETYLNKLSNGLKDDLLNTASKKGAIVLKSLDWEDFLNQEIDSESLIEKLKVRKVTAMTAGAMYDTEVQYLTPTERNTFINHYKSLEHPELIKNFTSLMVQGFGNKAPDFFREIAEKDNFIPHLGGLMLIDKNHPAIDKAINGFLLQKNKNIDIKISDTDINPTIRKYQLAYPENSKTFDAIVNTAKLIYSSEILNTSKGKNGVYDSKLFEQSMQMSMGENNGKGGVADYNGHPIHVPSWLEQDEIDNIMLFLEGDDEKINTELLLKATSVDTYEINADGERVPVTLKGKLFNTNRKAALIFDDGDPYLVSVGYGKYKIAMYNHPSSEGKPGYVVDGNYIKKNETDSDFPAILDFNKIREDYEKSRKK